MAGCKPTHHTTPELCRPDAGQISSQEESEQESLSHPDIALRSTSASTAIERRRWQAIGVLADGAPLAEIVAATGSHITNLTTELQRIRR
jgi:hypothetical protein